MPTMLRLPGKPKKIAYAILGEPANIKHKQSPFSEKVRRNLAAQETRLVR